MVFIYFVLCGFKSKSMGPLMCLGLVWIDSSSGMPRLSCAVMSFVLATYPIDSAVLHKYLPVCSSKFCICAIYTATAALWMAFSFTCLIYLYWVIRIESNISTYCYRVNLESSGMWHGIWRVVAKVLKVCGNFVFRSDSPRAAWTSWAECEGTVILQNVGN